MKVGLGCLRSLKDRMSFASQATVGTVQANVL
jgi:hypothetical protein